MRELRLQAVYSELVKLHGKTETSTADAGDLTKESLRADRLLDEDIELYDQSVRRMSELASAGDIDALRGHMIVVRAYLLGIESTLSDLSDAIEQVAFYDGLENN